MKESGKIETPFDIEAILRIEPKMLEMWKENPFYFDIVKGKVKVVYLDKIIRD